MDIKDVKQFLEGNEGKDLLKELTEANAQGLVDKNKELLGKLKKKDEEFSDLKDRLDDIEAEKKKAEEDAALKSGDIEKIKEQLEAKHKSELEKKDAIIASKDEELSSMKGQLHKHMVDDGLTSALAQGGVAPQYMDAASALIKAQHSAEVGKDGAMLEGKPLKDFVSTWLQGEHGEHFLTTPKNGGGGAKGPNDGGKAPSDTGRSEMTHAEKAAYIREHGKEAYEQLS